MLGSRPVGQRRRGHGACSIGGTRKQRASRRGTDVGAPLLWHGQRGQGTRWRSNRGPRGARQRVGRHCDGGGAYVRVLLPARRVLALQCLARLPLFFEVAYAAVHMSGVALESSWPEREQTGQGAQPQKLAVDVCGGRQRRAWLQRRQSRTGRDPDAGSKRERLCGGGG
jgi:hypothetical protein